MNQQNFDFNLRQRKKSSLGKRNLAGRKLSQLDLSAFQRPVISSAVRRSRLGRRPIVAKPAVAGCNKKLFEKSPQLDTYRQNHEFLTTREQETSLSVSPRESSGMASFDNSLLNVTGVCSIRKTPSPDVNSFKNHNISLAKPSDVSRGNDKFLKPYSEYQSVPQKTVVTGKNYCDNNYSTYKYVEPSKSLDLSQYNRSVLQGVSSLKPCVNNLELKSLSIKEDKQNCPRELTSTVTKEVAVSAPERVSDMFSPLLSSTCIYPLATPGSIEKPTSRMLFSANKMKDTGKKLSVINEDLDTTETFLLAEQTILDQFQTSQLPDVTTKSKTMVESREEFVGSKKETIASLETYSDDDLDTVLNDVDQGLKEMDRIMKKMSATRDVLRRLISKRKNRENKENVPTIASKQNIPVSEPKQLDNMWISNLKSENPALLKTPNISRQSMANRSMIWTPHSLCNALSEQVGELYD